MGTYIKPGKEDRARGKKPKILADVSIEGYNQTWWILELKNQNRSGAAYALNSRHRLVPVDSFSVMVFPTRVEAAAYIRRFRLDKHFPAEHMWIMT